MDLCPSACQNDTAIGASHRYPRLAYLARRLWRLGPRGVMRRIRGRLRDVAVSGELAGTKSSAGRGEILRLRAGELVEVKPFELILETLDASGKNRGLVFMPEMRAFCGCRLRVYKRVESIMIEHTGQLRRMRNTVLLAGAICDGWSGTCDRSCFYFWREAWLRRVENPPA